MTTTAEPNVEEMLAEVVAKAKEEGRQAVLTETRTLLTVLLQGCQSEKTFAGIHDGTIETRLNGKEQGLVEVLAWVVMTANGGTMPEEFLS